MRKSEIKRETKETSIELLLNIDGTGSSNIETGCGFLDHMLTLFAKHGRFDLDVRCKGDTEVDFHHTVEDVGICLGKAFAEAIGDKKGIIRYGNIILPMDEALVVGAVDISGRSGLSYKLSIPTPKVGTFDTELVEEFWLAFVREACCTLHFVQLSGTNSHHIIEGAFKAAGRIFRQAVSLEKGFENEIPSTKGVL